MSALHTMSVLLHSGPAAWAAALLAAAAFAQPASAKPAYIGAWALEAADCKTGDYAVQTTATTFGTFDATCEMRGVKGGRGVWRAKIKCTGEAAGPGVDTITMRANAKRMIFEYGSSPGQRYTVVRCK
jgi:chitodextrinase